MISTKLLNTAATVADQIASVNALSLTADKDYARGLAHAVASAYAFGWHHYQHDTMALTIAFAQRQVPIAEEGKNQWLPIARVCFGAWDETAAKVSFMGVSGLTKWKVDEAKQRYAGAMRLLHANGIHPDEAEQFILTFAGGLTGMVKADSDANGIKRAPRKPVSKERKAELVSKAKALPTLPEELTATLPVTGSAGHFAQAWVYIENGQVFLGGIVPNSENEALKKADEQLSAGEIAASTAALDGLFEPTAELVHSHAKMQRAFAATVANKQGGAA